MAPTKEDKQSKLKEITESEEEMPSKKSSSKDKKSKKSKKKSKSNSLVPSDQLSELTDGVTGGGQQQSGGGGGKKDGQQPLSLRLDLNLDVEITLKARVHGDVTLALLA
ncbi:hypothetical protein EDC96DRAFT_498692 [Choanephora cucurbitarum]|nr:hypothetical protein EDC96DRAFT_498692 [Choanephora cucurbitarum]